MTPATETRRAFDAMFPSVQRIGLPDRHAAPPLTDAQAERIQALTEAQQHAAKILVRSAVDCIKALPDWAFDQHLCGYLLAVVSQRIGDGAWSHTESAGIAQDAIDTTADYLMEFKHG